MCINKTGINMYFLNEDDKSPRFYLSRSLIKGGRWGRMDKAIQSVLPIIHHHKGKNGESYPSIGRVAAFSGVSYSKASQGMAFLRNEEGYSCILRKTKKERWNYMYTIDEIIKNDDLLRIEKSMVDRGYWAAMSASAKSLYLVLRVLANSDSEEFAENGIKTPEAYGEAYKCRNWDIISYDNKNQLAELSGIHRNSIKKAVADLKELKLIQDHPSYPDEYSIILISPPGDGFEITVKKDQNTTKSKIC